MNTLYLILSLAFAAADNENKIQLQELPPLPEGVSSFGGAVADGWLYVYGGHIGIAHEHSADNLSKAFRRLNLAEPQEGWEELPMRQPLQGVPMVAHDGKLYRVGGLSAKNAKGEDADLESVASVECFDPATKKWTELPSLPEGRSSHDAIVSNGKIYVVGGWTLKKDEQNWLTSALVLDLKDPSAGWKELPAPPSERRALAVAAARGKIYALGGMNSEDTPVGDVFVYDVASDSWSAGPAMPGNARMAFGMAAWGEGDDLFATKLDGSVYRLNKAGDAWDEVGKLPLGRFFHRLLPASDNELLVVAGANMGVGHLDGVAKFRVR